jgi:hypothetical protein
MALSYSLNAGGTSYSVVSNSCTAGAVVIPNTNNGLPVTAIGSLAFQSCFSLTSIIIPSSVTSIGAYAFDSCTGLTSVTIPNSVTSIESNAFQSCFSLTSIIIPSSVTSIGAYAFDSCTGLTSVTIPNGVTSLGYAAFVGCFNLTNVVIGNNIASIQDYTFYSCSSLIKINFLGNSPTLGGSDVFTFTNTNLKIYRKKNFVTGWSSTLGGKPVVLISDNVVKSGGTGKLITKNESNIFSITLVNAAITSSNGTYTWDNLSYISGKRKYFNGENFIYFDQGFNIWALADTEVGVTYASQKLKGGWTPGFEGYPPNPIVSNIIYS